MKIFHTNFFNFSQSAELERVSSVFSLFSYFCAIYSWAVVLLLWNIYADFRRMYDELLQSAKLNKKKKLHIFWKINTICVNIRMIWRVKDLLFTGFWGDCWCDKKLNKNVQWRILQHVLNILTDLSTIKNKLNHPLSIFNTFLPH